MTAKTYIDYTREAGGGEWRWGFDNSTGLPNGEVVADEDLQDKLCVTVLFDLETSQLQYNAEDRSNRHAINCYLANPGRDEFN